jgi:serine/threonine-protein kinase RsbT
VRSAVGAAAHSIGLSTFEKTRALTIASELARNVLVHAGGGVCRWRVVQDGARRGLELTFEDEGPGIADLDRAFEKGFSTAGGLGLGLGGSRRLADEFAVRPRSPTGLYVAATVYGRA